MDWDRRQKILEDLCGKYREISKGGFDCILPVSGGKDSSYVAYQMKNKMGMNPLAITIAPPLSFDIGNENLERFIEVGFNHIRVTPNPEVGRRIAKKAFIEQGQPLLAWIMSVQTVIFKLAVLLKIPFVMFGEEGETEYGGTSKLKEQLCYDVEDSINIYLSGNSPDEFLKEFTEQELYWWKYPKKEELEALKICVAHWSSFENWDPYEHYLFAKEHCGMLEKEERCISTYNNFAQTDTCLYDLHVYLMYLKFGFGRCTQDAGIDIRRGAISRKQALALVRKYDGEFPELYVEKYLKYFSMTRNEFDEVLDAHTNKKLFKKENGKWVANFIIE